MCSVRTRFPVLGVALASMVIGDGADARQAGRHSSNGASRYVSDAS